MIKDIGSLNGEVLVFGGIYSNLHALKALKEKSDLACIAPHNIICTGDIVAYCAYPEECVQLIKDWGIHSIQGNVEHNLIRNRSECTDCDSNYGGRYDEESKSWYPFLRDSLSQDSLDFFATLPNHIKFNLGDKRYFVLHGSIFDLGQMIYPSTDWQLKEDNFKVCRTDCIIGGHSGIPFIESRDNFTWFNAGSIGMPANDGNSSTWYLTLGEGHASFGSLKYDFENAANAFKGKPLPEVCANALMSGLWEEVELPSKEKSLAGLPLDIKKTYPIADPVAL